jgi:signal transduction histidine kinase
MIPHSEKADRPPQTGSAFAHDRWTQRPETIKGRILVVEDEEIIRDALGPILEEDGYQVTFAENGHEALRRLYTESLPDIIVLDLRMPVMDGWQFRIIQKDDPRLGRIPVVAISADGGPKAAAISAQAYLRKPVQSTEILATIERIRFENERQLAARADETERLVSLGRLAAGVGHEINNPLTYLSVNVDLAVTEIGSWLAGARAHAGAHTTHLGEGPASAAAATGSGPTPERLATLREMLEESRSGLRRIRDVVKNLQSLSRPPEPKRELFSLNEVLDESLAMARNHVDHRATVVKRYGVLPPLAGDRSAIGQVFLNLLLNAAQALPEGHAEDNEIVLTTSVAEGELAVEIRDTGAGIPRDVLPHIFEQFYTTKPIGEGTGLGLAVSHRIVTDHGGQIQVDSELGRGSTIRVVLPLRPLAERADRAQ